LSDMENESKFEDKKIVVAVSGYFDPVHEGHIEYFKLARKLGDKLIVILNSDKQAEMKKGRAFMSENGRKTVLESLEMVDEVIISVDEDRSVCDSIKRINPDIFANGGDRFSDEIPETRLCKELGIKIVDNLGKKIQSSSALVMESRRSGFERAWGNFISIDRGDGYQVKRLTLIPGKRISLQKHLHRSEHWVVVSGVAKVTLGEDDIILNKNESTYIPVGSIHRLENCGKIPLEIIEVQVGEYLGEDDIERFDDDFGRVDDCDDYCIGEGCGEDK